MLVNRHYCSTRCLFAERDCQPCMYPVRNPHQIRLRAERLNVNTSGLHLLAETDLDACIVAVETLKPRAVVFDSVQTLFSRAIDLYPAQCHKLGKSQIEPCTLPNLRYTQF